MHRVIFTSFLAAIVITTSFLAGERQASAQRAGLWPKGASTSLKLVRHEIQVQIRQPLAEITVTQVFDNPQPFQLEAYYYYPVPSGATVSNLALWVNGKRREARVMERQRAREIYQGIVDEKRDPALVERLSDELFRIRIFPVPARGRQQVQLRFVQPVGQIAPGHYRLLLRRPPGPTSHALRLAVTLEPAGSLQRAWIVGHPGRLERSVSGRIYELPMAAAPRSFERDIELHFQLRQPSQATALAVADGPGHSIVVAEVARDLDDAGTRARRVALLLDTSSSMKQHLTRARSLAGKTLTAQPPRGDTLVQLVPFSLLPREGAHLLMQPATRARIQDLIEEVNRTDAAGGSAFVPAFEKALAARADQVVLITDGASPYHQAELEHLLRTIFDQRGISVSVLLLGDGSGAQIDTLRQLAKISGGIFERPGNDPDRDHALVARLGSLAPPPVVRVNETPMHLLSAGPHRLLVAGRIPSSNAGWLTLAPADDRSVDLVLPGSPRAAPGAAALWANAEIDHLERRIKVFNEEEQLRERVVELSRRYRVASEYTAFLVTETDADYLRPTSGRKWQRQVQQMGDGASAPASSSSPFHSTPEPHEYALMILGMILLLTARRRGWIGAR
jgi:Ca-activated chloride channel family protein